MNTAAVSIEHLGFTYPGQSNIFTDLSLQIEAGERFGIFGPNGAGKTTLMHCMTGLLSFQQGKLSLFGNDIAKHLRSYEGKSFDGILLWVPDSELAKPFNKYLCFEDNN